MNRFLLFTLLALSFTSFSQDTEITKESFVGTWRACGDVNFDEEADTLIFQKATPPCRENDCGENDWSFRETGSVEFIFTDGCENGFNSKSKNPKRWMYIEKDQMLKFITNDGYIEFFEVLKVGEKLILVHRKDLEK